MSMRLIWLLVLAAVVTVTAAVTLTLCSGAVSYQGRSAWQWREELGSLDPEEAEHAWERLRTGGLEALPVVVALADCSTECAGLRGGQLLLEMASDLGPSAVPLLLVALADENAWRRSWAADALARVHPLPEVAVPPLLHASEDAEAMVRVAAVRALSAPGAWPDRVVPRLAALLTDPDAFVRQYAARGLRGFGDAARIAHGALLKAAEDESLAVSREAVESLAEIGARPEALLLLSDMLEHPEDEFAWWAAIALGRMGALAAPAVGSLSAALNREDPDLRAFAATALGHIGAPAAIATAHLLRALSDPEAVVRKAAAEALGRIGATDAVILETLEKMAAEEHEDQARQAAREALRRLRGS